MSHALVLYSVLFLSAAWIADEERRVEGTLVDRKCARFYQDSPAELPAHGKRCALGCKEEGYGVLVGKDFLTFDAAGNRLALQWLEQTPKDKNLKVIVIFQLDSSKRSYTVKSIADAPE
jgi:hypothetical protein